MNHSIFKMIWERRKRNRFLLVELITSFMVIFGICAAMAHLLANNLKPLGFNYDDVWELRFNYIGDVENRDLNEEALYIAGSIVNFKNVESLAFQQSYNYIFRYNHARTLTFAYNGERNFRPYVFGTTDEFNKVFKVQVIEGRWYNAGDDASTYRPIVLNKMLRDEVFGNRKAVGELIKTMDNQVCIVVGVIDDFRYKGDYSSSRPSFFARLPVTSENVSYPTHFNNISVMTQIPDVMYYIRVKPGTGIDMEENLTDHLTLNYPGWRFSVTQLKELRNDYLKRVWIPMIIVFLVAGFLIFNVVLGLFGVLWYNISLRRPEIGIRIATGATKRNIYRQFIGEMWILATLAVIPGLIIAIQFPVLGVFNIEPAVYVISILIATALIYLLVTLCTLMPSSQAARIQPAEALHEE